MRVLVHLVNAAVRSIHRKAGWPVVKGRLLKSWKVNWVFKVKRSLSTSWLSEEFCQKWIRTDLTLLPPKWCWGFVTVFFRYRRRCIVKKKDVNNFSILFFQACDFSTFGRPDRGFWRSWRWNCMIWRVTFARRCWTLSIISLRRFVTMNSMYRALNRLLCFS